MQLYTINATPTIASKEQYSKDGILPYGSTLKQYNKDMVDSYPVAVADVLSKHGLDGFTIYKVDGYWMGKPEVSFKIELAIDDKHWTVDGDIYSVTARVEKICEELRGRYNQDSVMLTLPDNSVKFIERP